MADIIQQAAAGPLPRPPALDATGRSLLLDFDGTLVELADRPDGVAIDAPLLDLLTNLTGTFGGRVSLVSGRSISQLEHFLGGALPALALVGSHGAELRASSRSLLPERLVALEEAEHIIRSAAADKAGVVIEVKSLGVAIHYRLAPAFEAKARSLAGRIASDLGLAVQEGKMMIELHAPGHDKGRGVASLMLHPPFAGTSPIFLGDDLTDEPGFAAVDRLGGTPILVGPPRQTAARFRLDDVAAVRAWLGQST